MNDRATIPIDRSGPDAALAAAPGRPLAPPAPHRPLRVIHAVPGCWLERTQVWLYHQIRHLPRRIESHVVCPLLANAAEFPLDRVHPAQADAAGRRTGDALLRALHLRRHSGLLARIARTCGADVLHSHFGPTGWENLKIAKRLGLKHVVSFYGLDVNYLPRQGWARRYLELFETADLFLCEGPHMIRRLEALGCPPQRLRLHHLGTPVGRIDYRSRFWNGRDPLRVLLAAAFREKKGLPDALAALGRLRNILPLQITIIGDAGPSPAGQREKRRILRAIETHGLASRTQRLGYQPHAAWLAEAYRHHLFLSPSRTAADGDTEGGAPVTLIEMASTGMPIVSTRHCDIPEVIVDEETGLLAPEGDVAGLAERVSRLAARPRRWSAMTDRGRARMEAQFDAVVQGDRLARIYESLHGRPHEAVHAAPAERRGAR